VAVLAYATFYAIADLMKVEIIRAPRFDKEEGCFLF